MNLSEGNLQILLLYKDEELFSFSKKISNENLRNESERVPEEIINNSINLSTNAMAEEFNLTDFERAKIVFATNASEVNTIVSKYKNRFLVEFTLGNYKIEHSYSGSLSEEVLRNEIEIDKELWLKDILGSLNEEKSYKEPFENLDASYSL